MIALLAAALAAQSPAFVAELTQFNEVREDELHVEESWGILSNTGAPASALSVPAPAGAKKLRVAPTSKGFSVAPDGRSVVASTALEPGEQRSLVLQYELPIAFGGRADSVRTLAFPIEAARFVFEASASANLASSEALKRTQRAVNGTEFVLWDMDRLPASRPLTLTWSSLPSPAMWPKHLALALSIGIALLTIYMVKTGRAPGAGARVERLLPLSAAARRGRLVKAVELLDRERSAGKIEPEAHQARREALVRELAVVLRELDLERR